MVTSRSSSHEPSQVTPSADTAKAMAMTRRAKQTARSTSVDIDRPRSNTTRGEEEEEPPVKRGRKTLRPRHQDGGHQGFSPPSRRSASAACRRGDQRERLRLAWTSISTRSMSLTSARWPRPQPSPEALPKHLGVYPRGCLSSQDAPPCCQGKRA